MTTTFDRLCAILAKDYKLAGDKLTRDAPLESLGIDSLGVAELLFNVEDEFSIVLPPEPVELLSIADVSRYIDVLIAVQHGQQELSELQAKTAPSAAVLAPATPST